MTAHFDPLEQHDNLRRPFMGALLMHACLFTAGFTYSWYLTHNRLSLGDPNAMKGGPVGINLVKNIPMPPAQTVLENPVANDTHSSVPTPPPEETKKAEEKAEPPDALPLPTAKPKKPQAERRAPPKKFRPYIQDRENQLYSSKGMGVNTQSYSGLKSDSFGVGIGSGAGSPFGAYYGWYAEALQRRLGEQWQREISQLDPRFRNAPRTVVFFEIQRDGSLKNVRVQQSSGNATVDYAALRAATNANPVPPLPSGIAKPYLGIEVWFQIKQ